MTPKQPRAPETAPYFFQVYGHADLCGPWTGWRIRGAWLIAPTGERINPQRLQGLVLVEQLQQRVRRALARTTPGHQGNGVTLLDLRHFRDLVQGELRTR